jgi:hypothetical protein
VRATYGFFTSSFSITGSRPIFAASTGGQLSSGAALRRRIAPPATFFDSRQDRCQGPESGTRWIGMLAQDGGTFQACAPSLCATSDLYPKPGTGQDPQLERGVAEVMKKIQTDPKAFPKRPEPPLRTQGQ